MKAKSGPLERLVPEARSAEGQMLRAQRSSPFPRRCAPRERKVEGLRRFCAVPLEQQVGQQHSGLFI